MGFEVKYPPNFNISYDNGISISSESYSCETEQNPPSLGRKKINASEIKIDIKKLTGNNYEDIWQQAFGFKLISKTEHKNYDGIEFIDKNKAYYFYQGAEMVFGRKAILVPNTQTSAFQIDIWKPILVYKCDEYLNKYPEELINQILSTFQFLPDTTNWKTYSSQKHGFTFSYPQKWTEYTNETSPSSININTHLPSGQVLDHTNTSIPLSFHIDLEHKSIVEPHIDINNIALTVDNRPAYQTTGFPDGTLYSFITFIPVNNNQYLKISCSPYFKQPLNENQNILHKQYNQILSTFQFLD